MSSRRRTVIVTGGSRGLGLAVAQRLAADGFRVVAVARRRTEELSAASATAGDALRFWPCDLSETAGLPLLVKEVRREYGSIYGLVNNAGVGTAGLLAALRTHEIERLVRLNTLAPILLTRAVIRAMLADDRLHTEGGRIVSIASIVATTGYRGLAAYGATKASLIGFTRSLARELGPLGITVNAVSPGFIDTAMTEELGETHRARIARRSALQRLAEAEDVAGAVAFLVSDAARNITGTVLTVDAGGTA